MSTRIPSRVPGTKRHNFVVTPMTRLGKWALGLVAAVFALAVSLGTVVPGDSLAAFVIGDIARDIRGADDFSGAVEDGRDGQ